MSEEKLTEVVVEETVEVVDAATEQTEKPQKRGKKRRIETTEVEKPVSEWEERVVQISRVTKVVKGGKNMRLSALVVVGNKKGQVGMGINKAIETPAAIEKAGKAAKKALINVPIVDGTIPHEVIGKFAKTSVKMLPARQGSGLIAGGAARQVLDLAGIKDITAKIYGSTDPINVVRATLNGLKSLRTKEQVAMLRGKSVEEI